MKSSNLVLRLSFPTPEEREESLQGMRRRERPRHEVEKRRCVHFPYSIALLFVSFVNRGWTVFCITPLPMDYKNITVKIFYSK